MHQVRLSDQLYEEARRRATEAGFTSVDDYIADVLKQDFQDEIEDLERFFRPERLAQIDRAAAQIKAGQSVSSEQVREHFQKKTRTMTRKKAQDVPVVYALAALAELDEIWTWNENAHGRRHAANYVAILIDRIERLAADP